MKTIIGIDPGASGALSFTNTEEEKVYYHKCHHHCRRSHRQIQFVHRHRRQCHRDLLWNKRRGTGVKNIS